MTKITGRIADLSREARVLRLAAAFLLSSLLFLSLPEGIVRGNQLDIAFDRTIVMYAFVAFAAFAIVLSCALLLTAGKRVGDFLVKLVIALVINILIWNLAFGQVAIETYRWLVAAVAVEIGLFALTFWALNLISSHTLAMVVAIFAVLNLAIGAYGMAALGFELPAPITPSAQVADNHPIPTGHQNPRIKGNVYHVVLDAFSTEYLSGRLETGKSVDLPGYTFYPEATANYGRTSVSMASVFSGQLHRKDLLNFADAYQSGFMNELSEAGVNLHSFPYYGSYCHTKAITCRPTKVLSKFYRKHIGPEFVVDIVFQSAMPFSLRNLMVDAVRKGGREPDTWDYGFSLSAWLRGISERGSGYPKWRQPIQSLTVDTVDMFLAEESKL
ncbi:MAG: hypothetical protein H0T56_03235, partial [Pseudaminobacter sp.]|nr:hypothetical protein [Pseudaminobacter sp.]